MVNLSRHAERADELLSYEGLKQNWILISLVFTVSIALYLRYLPEQGMQYLQALDPYMIFRMSKHLALEGNLPLLDFSRYFPYATPTHILNQGNIFVPAFMYYLGPFLFMNYLEWAQLYPALMGAIGVLGTYFLGKEIFDRETGLASAFFLATIAGVMHRTTAGFFEKEPTGTAFMMFSMFFFVRAWKREEYIWGVLSGIMMALFTVSWGGSKMLWLLYPMTVGVMLWMNSDIRGLVKAYTPLVVIGVFSASGLNPSRFWLTGTLALVNFGMLGLLWGRYLVEELSLVKESYYKFYTPAAAFTGLAAIALSPLYSPWVARKASGFINLALRKGNSADVVAGTVAENQAASLSQVAGQLGALSAGSVLPPGIGSIASLVANLNGAWPLAFIGVVFLGTHSAAMVFRNWNLFGFGEEVEGKRYYQLLIGVLVAWSAVFSILFQDPITFVVGPSFVAILGGLGILYSFDGLKEKVSIDYHWYYLLPIFWAATNILAAVTRSRLVFLAAFPTAFVAGYTFTKVLRRIRDLEDRGLFYIATVLGIIVFDVAIVFVALAAGLQIVYALLAVVVVNGAAYLAIPEERIDEFEESIPVSDLRKTVLAVIVIATVVVNLASGFNAASRLGGSPNSAWDTSLDYMREQTPKNSVILSWWDYGYWFESIGRRAAVADGGNLGYYTSDRKINYPLADYLASETPENTTDFLEKQSVDYIVLDSSMIGKYSAVSQIHKGTNKRFNSMLTFSTSGGLKNSMSRQGNETIVTYSSRAGRLYVPYRIGTGNIRVSSPPLLETGKGRVSIDCVLTDSGAKMFDTNTSSSYCLARHPFYSIPRASQGGNARVVLVPKEIRKTVLVRLYLMDGYGIDYVKKLPEASNGYVKMWKVNGIE
ncbi:MAG: STT3 domain-containing protein [Candidatus Nanohaloarchaea archaeon]